VPGLAARVSLSQAEKIRETQPHGNPEGPLASRSAMSANLIRSKMGGRNVALLVARGRSSLSRLENDHHELFLWSNGVLECCSNGVMEWMLNLPKPSGTFRTEILEVYRLLTDLIGVELREFDFWPDSSRLLTMAPDRSRFSG
jgi:hypothetical protein